MDYKDIVADFEMTSFYMGKRWRSDVKIKYGGYFFDETGVMQDNDVNLVAFGKAYDHVMEKYGDESGKFSAAVENYLVSVVGLGKNDIETIRSIMIAGYESDYTAVNIREEYFAVSKTDDKGNIIYPDYKYTLNETKINKISFGDRELLQGTDYTFDESTKEIVIYNSFFYDLQKGVVQTLCIEEENETLTIDFGFIATFAVTKASDMNSGSASTASPMMIACGLPEFTNAASDRPIWSGYIVLACDIDFGGVNIVNKSLCANAYGGTGWGFKGTFDGCGHTLSNFTIIGTNVSLFGRIEFGGKIKNTRFVDFSTGGTASFGLFDSVCYGYLENLYIEGTCNSTKNSGSLLGTPRDNNENSGAMLINCEIHAKTGDATTDGYGVFGKSAGFLSCRESVIYTDYQVAQSFTDAGGEVKPLE